jgi:hypothetical protein
MSIINEFRSGARVDDELDAVECHGAVYQHIGHCRSPPTLLFTDAALSDAQCHLMSSANVAIGSKLVLSASGSSSSSDESDAKMIGFSSGEQIAAAIRDNVSDYCTAQYSFQL